MKPSELERPSVADTAPTSAEVLELLSVAELKAVRRVKHSQEDALYSDAIVEAYSFFDANGWLNRAILNQTWKAYAQRWDSFIELPFPPLKEVTGITYVDTEGATQTLSTDVYGVSKTGLFGKVFLKADQTWPDVGPDPDPIEITFQCGYGNGAEVKAAVPGIRKAIKLLATHFFENPSQTYAEPRLVEVPRQIMYGITAAAGKLRIMNDQAA
ncbi:MAG: hypothetical protein JJ979_25370 [Roseibium sp.]|nr:hypothetical protein [Roseibium sp.]